MSQLTLDFAISEAGFNPFRFLEDHPMLGSNTYENSDPLLLQEDLPDGFRWLEKTFYTPEWDAKSYEIIPNGRLLISGKGKVTRESCSTIREAYASKKESGGYDWKYKLNHCDQQGCPRCYSAWAALRGAKAGVMVFAAAKLLHHQLFHFVYSPIRRTTINSMVESFKKEAKKWHSANYGEFGAVYVIHPYRLRCSRCNARTVIVKVPGGESRRVCENCYSNEYLQWRYSPHIHFISNFFCNSRFEIKGESFEDHQKANGFVIRNVTKDHGSSNLNQKQCQDKIRYLLTHAAYVEGKQKHALRYVGAYSMNKMKYDIKEIEEIVKNGDKNPYRRVELRQVETRLVPHYDPNDDTMHLEFGYSKAIYVEVEHTKKIVLGEIGLQKRFVSMDLTNQTVQICWNEKENSPQWLDDEYDEPKYLVSSTLECYCQKRSKNCYCAPGGARAPEDT